DHPEQVSSEDLVVHTSHAQAVTLTTNQTIGWQDRFLLFFVSSVDHLASIMDWLRAHL
ncbi:MAG: hypothetical protein JWN30_1906, partial [Bacilli bacterium]|nr:hypothetical protein [Bacilli bacterium]